MCTPLTKTFRRAWESTVERQSVLSGQSLASWVVGADWCMLGGSGPRQAGDATDRCHSVANFGSGRLAEFGWPVCPMAACLFLFFGLRLCPRYRSCLPQASHLAGFGIVTSVIPFGWSRRSVRFAGKHVHRPAKLLHRGSCRLERTST